MALHLFSKGWLIYFEDLYCYYITNVIFYLKIIYGNKLNFRKNNFVHFRFRILFLSYNLTKSVL